MGPAAFAFDKEELTNILKHEASHCKDFRNVLSTPGSLMRRIFDQGQAVPPGLGEPFVRTFSEAGGYRVNVSDPNVSYKFLITPVPIAATGQTGTEFDVFKFYYDGAKDILLPKLSGTTRSDAKALLQTLYDSVVGQFPELKDKEYAPHLSPP